MTFSNTERVLVAGGGIAGSAVARALHRRGIASNVFERRAGVAEAGLAVNLPGNAIQALADLGLAEAVTRLGAPVRRREYRTERDRLLFAIDETAFWGADAAPRCLRRADLLRLLQRDFSEGTMREGTGVAAIRQDAEGATVALSDGSIETGGMLVGADGVHSTVRRSLFGDDALGAARLASASWRFMTPNPGIEHWTVWGGAGGLFLLIPVDRDEAYGWVSVTGAATKDLAAMRTVFDRFPRIVRETLDDVLARPSALYHSPLEEVRLPTWHRGRVLLTGDAAHATAPVWAQGVALALEDALVLAACLAEEREWTRIGPLYEERRRSRVAHVQAMTDRLSRTANLSDWARSLLLPIVGPRSYRATYGPLRSPVAT